MISFNYPHIKVLDIHQIVNFSNFLKLSVDSGVDPARFSRGVLGEQPSVSL